ncbi:MAG: AAA domain-containing protein [Desulfotomaculaceae bacterium]|nr:AAA domain-containing protein [Desulfotomaculaceae bacterium]
MNIEKHLILIKGEDKTADISRCRYEGGQWHVTFSDNRAYSYHYLSIQWLRDPVLLLPETTVVYQNGQTLSGVDKILDFGDYIRICFVSGYNKLYRSYEIRLEQSLLSNKDAQNSFEYLKQLAQRVSIKSEDDISLLGKQYEKITCISPSSVLAKYLYPAQLNKPMQGQMPIFPFGFNLSQKNATEKALANQISVIEGPPGTGKTQTILNLIANAVINGKTVAVVSNNNAATANVLEKLQKYGVDFITAYLGNRENKENFMAGQTGTYPDMSTWVLDVEEYQAIKLALATSGKELDEMLEAKNQAAILRQELSALSTEKQYFYTYNNETNERITPYRALYKHNSNTVMALWLDYQRMAEENKTATLRYKLKNLLHFGIISFSFYKNSPEMAIALFQRLYYERKTEELREQIHALNVRLAKFRFDDAITKYTENSMKLFKAKLADRYLCHQERQLFTQESLWKDFNTFIKEYPVILSTTHSLRSCAGANYLFDYVIMDEASQVDIVTGALALSCAKNAVIVGDLKQLPNVVPESTAAETNLIFENFALDPAYRYADNSMLSSVTKLYQDIPRTLLKEHYRCHPKIIGFCNQKFYNNELIVLTDEKDREQPLVVYKTAKGHHARGKYNQRQIDVILQEVLPDQIGDDHEQSVGIISPYRLQKEKLKVAMGSRNIEVDTVHKYQGRERDVIILTTVANEVNDFVDNPNLINVAVSRAVDKLIVVVSDDERNDNTNIGDLVKYIEYNNFEIINSNIYSVFDLLYHSYSEHLNEIRKNRKNVSAYESENLMNAVIEKVLNQPEFSNLDRVIHQPLKMLIRNPEKLDENELRFAMNVLTHTDFVIFNKLDKMPVLVVEVDGYAFHANNPKQLARDKMKDNILRKYGIPILRIGTNESGEETRLRNKLRQVLKRDERLTFAS